jgi:ribosomal protein S18 acetylase RimI-like enzyme
MTWEQFVAVCHSRGWIYTVNDDGVPAGYYWIELKGGVLHIHGIVDLPECRGRGIDIHILRSLAREYAQHITAMELGVKDENVRASLLYDSVRGFCR